MAAKYVFRTVPDAPIKCKECVGTGQVQKSGKGREASKCRQCSGSGRSNPLFGANPKIVRNRK